MLTTSPLSSHHLKYLQWGHNHFHTEGQTSPETQGDKRQDPTTTITTTTHATWRCRTDLPLTPHLCIPAQDPWRQRTLLEGGVFWALSYTWSLPPSCWDTSDDTLKQAKACTENPKWRLIPEKTQHPPKQMVVTDISAQQLMHTDTICSTEITFFKTSAFLYCCHACWHENDTLEQHTCRRPTNWSNRWITPPSHWSPTQDNWWRHCWQHHQAHSEPIQAQFWFYVFPPTWKSASLSCSFSSSLHLFPALIFLLHASLLSYPPPFSFFFFYLFFFFSLFYFFISYLTLFMWCRFGNLRLRGASFPTEMFSGSLKAYQWVLSGLFQKGTKRTDQPSNGRLIKPGIDPEVESCFPQKRKWIRVLDEMKWVESGGSTAANIFLPLFVSMQ